MKEMLYVFLFTLFFAAVAVERKNRRCCSCFFFFNSRSLGDYAILLPPKRAGTRNANFHSDLHEGVDVRTIF